MYANSSYLNNSLDDVVDLNKPLVVTSSGYYHLISRQSLETIRPTGRCDYQLIYIESGQAHFFFENEERIITAGHMILYRPSETQKYIYYLTDKPEVYWIHFTGNSVEKILSNYGLEKGKNIFYSGSSPDYKWLFRQIIQELHLTKEHFADLLSMYLRQIFLHLSRNLTSTTNIKCNIQTEIQMATFYFNENYNTEINIEEYAASRFLSTCWFIRNFKQYTGYTPMQYILSI